MSYDSVWVRALRVPILAPLRQVAIRLLDRVPLRVLADLQGGGRMYVDLSSAVGRGIWLTGQFDAGVAAAFSRLLRPGDVALDVGANCGFFSVLASRLVGPEGLVIAVDMHHRALELLRATRRRFRLANVSIIETAVGAETSVVAAEFTRDSAFSRVAMLRLDDIVPRMLWSRLRLVKMDIEGCEPAAIDGARTLLAEARPAVAMEIAESNLAHFGYSVTDVFDRMVSAGFRCETLDGSRPLAARDVGRDIYNVLFRPVVS